MVGDEGILLGRDSELNRVRFVLKPVGKWKTKNEIEKLAYRLIQGGLRD